VKKPNLYNTLSRQIEPLNTKEPGRVGLYVCGVTVYNLCHIGHARAYVAFDVLLRALRALGYEVKYVRNFTDVDDKIINAANAQGIDALDLANRYIDTFREDMRALGCIDADVEPRVSTHITEIIDMVLELIARGHAYEAQGDVYFAVRSFKSYGKLGRRDLDDLRAGARVEPGEAKRDPLDFALWKAKKPGEPSWESPWGDGRPGWHIECSAMSTTHLGCDFDIHGGGSDLIFPHHENEIAQTEGATGENFVRHWMHNGFVNVDNEKMSKSLGNFFTIREVMERFSGEAIRYFLLTTHYRQPINFSDVPLTEAADRMVYLYETLARADEAVRAGNCDKEPLPVASELRIKERLESAICDDLNTPVILSVLADTLRTMNSLVEAPPETKSERKRVAATLQAIRSDLDAILAVVGIGTADPQAWLAKRRDALAGSLGLDLAWVEEQIQVRSAAKLERDFAGADAVRDALTGLGVELLDTRQGTIWRLREDKL
jgi:cysteinyl-tRNA synthetase